MDSKMCESNSMDWVFFDLDDTLWDFSQNSMKTLSKIYDTTPLLKEKFASFEAFSDEYHIHNSRMWQLLAEGKVSSSFLRTERWRLTLFPESSADNPPEFCGMINDRYLNLLATQPHALPHAAEVLEKLTKTHLVGILSNGFSDTQYKKLANSGLDKYITRTVTSEEIGIQKPDPKIFRYAEIATGTKPSPIFVGDNPLTDIIGALKAGWRVIWLCRDNSKFPFTNLQLNKEGINHKLFLGTVNNLREAYSIIISQN